ncbi:TetR/AcrR family transcriptional regulator [Neisseriaceae bacterium CLB008]
MNSVKAPQKPRKLPKQARAQYMVNIILEATARILAKRGYAGTNTNLIASEAGVSVGSIYQYFPNKDALISALHERHAEQMAEIIDTVFADAQPHNLREHVSVMVHSLMAAHQCEPQLHQVLEREFPYFDVPNEQSPADQLIFQRVRRLLASFQEQITQTNLDLATWTVMQITEALVHTAVIDPPANLSLPHIEEAIIDAIMGYLTVPKLANAH